MLRLKVAVFSIVAIALFLVKTPNALAQTTTITDVSYTRNALFDIDTQTPSPPIVVNATIGYRDAMAGYYLAVGVFDLEDGNLVEGLGSSNPQPCSISARFAGCIVPLTHQQGSEIMQFSLIHPKGTWNLALIAALLDNTKNPISNSFSDYTFTINVQTALTLTVNVPTNVRVSVDGVNGSGSAQLVLAAGNHTVSVPDLVTLNSTTRLRFASWSDGVTAPNRSVALDHDITLTGNYAIQYRLDIVSPVTVGGAGWYDRGATVTLSIESATEPMAGIIGALGGRWIFEGWGEGASEISRSPIIFVTMDSAQVVKVVWTPDYSIPLGISALILLLSAASLYIMRMRVRNHSRRRGRRMARSQSHSRSRKRR